MDAPASLPALPLPQAVLCVDDEPNILSALRRSLRGPGLTLHTAGSGAEALELLAREPVDLVISDMRMPGMNGTQLLEQVQRAHPDIVRVILTGQADLKDTIAAINHGSVYRYLQKPWDDAELKQVVQQGLERRGLELERRRLEALTQRQNLALNDANTLLEQRVAQRTTELAAAHGKLKHTYLTAIQVFSGLLELRSGRYMGHGRRVADTARRIGAAMGLGEPELQELLVAGLLHDVGLIGLPDAVLQRPEARLSGDERALYRQHPTVGEHSLLALDEMQGAAALIRSHHERHDGKGFPHSLAGHDIPLGARILAVADTFDALLNGLLVESTATVAQARTLIQHTRGTQFDPEVVDVFLHITEPERPRPVSNLRLTTADLTPGMVLAADLHSSRGLLLLTTGRALSARLIQHLREFEARDAGPLDLRIRRGTGEAHD
ncbi:MAG: response regulator [Rubrivivax sp.]|nr:response regulator [Rubrivivax sp.]